MCNCGAKRNLPGPRAMGSRPPQQTRQVTVTVTTTPPRSILMTRGRKVAPRSYDVVRTLPVDPVDTSIWGAHVWRILHAASLYTAPKFWTDVEKELDGAFPCPDCAQHYHDWLRAHPITVRTQEGIRDWWLALHNAVNERRKVATWSVGELLASCKSVTVDAVRGSLDAVASLLGSRGVAVLRRLVDNIVITEHVTVEPVTVETSANAEITDVPTLVIEETTE